MPAGLELLSREAVEMTAASSTTPPWCRKRGALDLLGLPRTERVRASARGKADSMAQEIEVRDCFLRKERCEGATVVALACRCGGQIAAPSGKHHWPCLPPRGAPAS